MELLPNDLEGLEILDVACGFGSWGYQIRILKEGSPFLLGLDVWKPYILRTRKAKIYDEIVVADARFLPFKNNVFDIVIACEVLEHLNRKDGLRLVQQIERVCRTKAIASTPLGFKRQAEIAGNPHQKHLLGWQADDLTRLGYKTRIVDLMRLPRMLRVVDGIRRAIFSLRKPKEIIAWKTLTH
ncbi:MAG: class I SAM-dependent methyltransferase [Candidatus Bathyarchaeia archaeon]